jgi:hypothetical protein
MGDFSGDLSMTASSWRSIYPFPSCMNRRKVAGKFGQIKLAGKSGTNVMIFEIFPPTNLP